MAGAGTSDRYRIGEELGQGAIGSVVAARDTRLDRELAIKRLVAADRPDLRERFIEEARITAQLQHPNIVPIHELGHDDHGVPFIVMKRVEGTTFTEVIHNAHRRRPTAPALRPLLESFLKVCDAVAYAHSRGVLHRDLKPDNIMIGRFGEVLVMDWGLARHLRETGPASDTHSDSATAITGPPTLDESHDPPPPTAHVRATLQGEVKGTPGYMAPEQAQGSTQLDEGADIHALGAILYTILTDRVPVEGRDLQERLAAIREGHVRPPSRRTPHVRIPRELEAVAMRAMAPRRRDRFEDVPALQAEIESWLDGRTLESVRYSLLQRAIRFVRRNRVAALVLLVLVLAGVGVAVAVPTITDANRRADEQARIAERRQVVDAAYDALADTGTAAQASEAAPPQILAQLDGLESEHGDGMGRVTADEELRTLAPDLAERAAKFAGALAVRRRAVLDAWVDMLLGNSPPAPGTATGPDAVADAWPVLRANQTQGHLPAEPVAEVACWLARSALQAGNREDAARWVANAWIAGPATPGASRAFALLGADSLAQRQYRQAAMQYHLALAGLTVTDRTRPGALFGLTRALASLGADARAPFAPDVHAREMALRVLLRLVDTDGRLYPEVAAVVPAATRDRLAREAADWLFVLRRQTVGTPVAWRATLDLDGDGLDDTAVRPAGPLEVELVQPVPPSNDAPLAAPREQTVMRFDLGPVLEHELPDEVDEQPQANGPWPIRLRDDGDPLFLFEVINRSRGVIHLVAVEGPESTRAVFQKTVPAKGGFRPHGISSGDVDGNGYPDLVLGYTEFRRRVQVQYQLSPNRLTGAALSKEDEAATSDVHQTAVVDLDGNGRNELFVLRGPWSHFCIEAWHPDPTPSRSRLLDRVRIGNTSEALILHTPDGVRVVTASSFTMQHAAGFDDAPELDLRVWEFGPGGFQALPAPRIERRYDASGEHPFSTSLAGFQPGQSSEPEDNRCAILESMRRENAITGETTSGLHWHVMDGVWPSDSLRTVTLPASAASHATIPGFVVADGRLYGRLSDHALQELMGRGVPTADEGESAEPVLSVARVLMRGGLPAEAVRYARAALAAPPDAAGEAASTSSLPASTRTALVRLMLHALTDGGDAAATAGVVRDQPVDAALAADVLVAVDELAARHGTYRTAAALLGEWARAAGLPEDYRRRFLRRAAAWGRVDEQLADVAVDWRGLRVRGRNRLSRPLSDLLVANRPGMLQPPHADSTGAPDETGPLPVVLGDGPTVIFLRDPQGQIQRATVAGCAGLPVHLGGGSFRLTVDLTIDGAVWSSTGAVGLVELDTLADPLRRARDAVAVRVGCAGGNGIYAAGLRAGGCQLTADTLVGQPIRVDLQFIAPAELLLMTVADPRTRTVVFTARSRLAAPAAGAYLLGVFHPRGPNRVEARLARVVLAGDARLLERDDPEVEHRLANAPDVAMITMMERLRLGPTRQRAMVMAAARMRTARGAADADAGSPAGTRWHPRWLAFDQAWCASDQSPAGFADRLDELPDHEDGVATMLSWLVSQPTRHPPPGMWEGAGEWLARHELAAVAPADRAAELARRVEAGEVAGNAALIMAARLDRRLFAHVVYEGLRSQADSGVSPVGLLPLAAAEYLADDAGTGLHVQAGVWHAMLMHRSEGIRRMEAAGLTADASRLLRWQSRLHELRLGQIAFQRAHASRTGVRYPAVGGE